MDKISKRNSIGFRLAIIFICVVLVQCFVMGFMLIAGGVVSETETNSYRYFSSQVESRKTNFEDQIQFMWTDFSTLPQQISQKAAEYRTNTPLENQTEDDLLRALAPNLIELLKRTKATGAFLILPNDGGEEYSALYIRNLNPNQKGQNSYNLTLKAGPLDLKKAYNFSTSDKWEYKLRLDESNNEFYKKTYNNMQYDVDNKLLYYWSQPFALSGEKEKAVTYSIPLKDGNNQELGVLGIDLRIDYIYDFLPKSDLVGDNSLGFMIAMRDKEEGKFYPIIAKEALHGKVIDLKEPIQLEKIDKGLGIYEITNTIGDHHIFSCGKQMNMYSGNTPFSNEEWYLVGLMNKSELHQFSDKIATIMKWSLSVTVILGIIAAVFITRRFSKPIVRLADEVISLSGEAHTVKQGLSKTGLYEIDLLSEAILTAQKRMSSLNDKLKDERDRDSMTKIRNRHSFNEAVALYNLNRKEYRNMCMGIFDLNGLKEVNDKYGHEYGDMYICDSVKLISKVFWENHLYRIGGDEFTIIMTDTEPERLEEKKKELSLLVAEYNKKNKFKSGIAFGYEFCLYEEKDTLEQALKRADLNMYAEKKNMKEKI